MELGRGEDHPEREGDLHGRPGGAEVDDVGMPVMRPFAPREVTFLGVREIGAWALKVYGVRVPGPPLDRSGFDRALDLAAAALPPPALEDGRPGLGLFIAHQGRTGDYGVLGWWDHENELPLRIWVRRSPSDPWRPAADDESVCVWDLEIIWEERQAWIQTMLSGGDLDPEAYLTRVPERFIPG